MSASTLRGFFVCLTLAASINAQKNDGPVARFDFNGSSRNDPRSGLTATLVGASYTNDRFGNADNAVYVYGNEFSYVNLGASKLLKNRQGSVSFWAKIEAEVWSGTGYHSNPLIIAKRSKGDNFYEAFGVYYQIDTKRIATCFTRDSVRQINITSMQSFSIFRWHHLVITYDDHFFAFYIDGKLEKKIVKNFPTVFVDEAPLLMGVTANKKNNRFSQASLDDVVFYDRVITPDEVRTLFNEPDPNKSAHWRKLLLLSLAAAAGVGLIYWIVRYSLNRKHRKEKEKLEIDKQRLETELRVNRALMNPHFVFNSMYALQNLILKEDYRSANEYLVKFSKLMRKILEHSMEETIGLDVEIDLLKRYLEIENLRFEKNIHAEIDLGEGVVPSSIRIPVMMVQPFVENSIWHGLLKKEGEKRIRVEFRLLNGRYLRCTIDDNGIGRAEPLRDDTDKKSMATGFVAQRLRLLNEIHGLECRLEIEDKPKGHGTTVIVDLPVLNKLS
jgi:hypothetical protein